MQGARQPRSKQIARELSEAILSGRLKPGTRLPQEMVAQQFGGSRVPVQQALRELADEGLVTLVPNVGARVALFDLSELIETYRGRECLEPMVLAESIPHLKEEDVALIERLVEETETCAAAGDPLGHITRDRPLHFATFRGADMPRLLRIIEGFWETTQRYRQIYGLLPTSMEISVLEHRLLLNHIKSRNPDDAARILITHIRRTRLTLAEHLHEMRDQWNGNGSSAGWVDVAAPAP